jgi:predicted kinase
MPGRLILLCGRSFSGKSTVAAALAAALGGTIVSFDAINAERGLHGGRGIPVSEWARTFEIANQRAADALRADRTVIVDDTSSPRFLRDRWRELSSTSDARLVLVFVDASPQTILERQAANRSGQQRDDVTDAVMTEHLATFEPPDADENALGFTAENLVMDVVIAEVTEALSASP